MQATYYLSSAVEQAMKIQEVILRAIAGQLKWYQKAEILGISDRQIRWLILHLKDNLEQAQIAGGAYPF